MTIQFEKLKARLLATPKVSAEYDALAPRFKKRTPRTARFAAAPPPQPQERASLVSSPASAGEGAHHRRRRI